MLGPKQLGPFSSPAQQNQHTRNAWCVPGWVLGFQDKPDLGLRRGAHVQERLSAVVCRLQRGMRGSQRFRGFPSDAAMGAGLQVSAPRALLILLDKGPLWGGREEGREGVLVDSSPPSPLQPAPCASPTW